jgi:hypothetical protein
MKFLRYFFLLLFSLLWLAGCSRTIIEKLYATEIIPDDYRFGDLYRLSYLPQFKEQRAYCHDYTPPQRAAGRKVHLYLIGDSFTEAQRVGAGDFAVDAYHYVKWDDVLHVRLDTTATNVLLMESVERNFRYHLTEPVRSIVPDTATFEVKYQETRLMPRLDQQFAANPTEDRLDLLLFQNTVSLVFKEMKARFNYLFFDRPSDKVTVSPDGQHLVYYMDTDSTQMTSSFAHLRHSQVDTLVGNLNRVTDSFRAMGFDHVLLSIIPNKTSVLMPGYGPYNRLIERVYNHPSLGIPYVDVLPEFRQLGEKAYLRGDSHWTCRGQYLWLDKTNQLIQTVVAEANSSL